MMKNVLLSIPYNVSKMGGASFDPGHWKTFTATRTAGKATSTVFAARTIKESLDPLKMKNMMRESCDDDMASLCAAIVSNDDGVFIGEEIGHQTFSFVSPTSTNNSGCFCHNF